MSKAVPDVQKQLKKKTQEELNAMATSNRPFSAESIEEPPPLTRKPSESSLDQLNTQLRSVPIVKAFNSAENHLEPPKQQDKK